MAYDVLCEALDAHRKRAEKIVFTNGCFDLLHRGHVRYLAQARALGDVLVLGLNSDSSVRALKGESRPILDEEERAEVLRALESVNYVEIFDQPTPLSLIQAVRPDVLAKGGDWALKDIVGADFVQSYGGRVVSLGFVEGSSTTDIVQRILSR